MRKICSILLVLMLVFMATACGTPPAGPGSTVQNTPPWINDLPPEDVLWGIGSAKQSSDAMSMTTAEARARVSIARQLDTKVKAMFTDYNLDAGNVGNIANATLQEEVSRQITNTNLSGARPIQRWIAADGTWWYLMEFKKSDAKNTVAGILGNQEAAFAQFKAQQALDILEAQLTGSTAPLQVNN